MEILPQVHWLRAGYANVYLCVEEAGATLIDSGTPGQAELVLAYLRDLGRAAAYLKQILITHADYDHAGSAAELQRQTGATIVAAASTVAYLRRGRAPRHLWGPLSLVGSLFNRYPKVPRDGLVATTAGDVLPVLGGLQVLATPGHTPDHHAFFSPSRGVLFAGDAFTTRSGRLKISPKLITDDTEAARRSMRRLLHLAPAVFACGHGEPLLSHSSDDLMNFLRDLE